MKQKSSKIRDIEKKYMNKMKSFNVKVEQIICSGDLDKIASKVNARILKALLYEEESALIIFKEIKLASKQESIRLEEVLQTTTASFMERVCSLISLSTFSDDEEVKDIADSAIENMKT